MQEKRVREKQGESECSGERENAVGRERETEKEREGKCLWHEGQFKHRI